MSVRAIKFRDSERLGSEVEVAHPAFGGVISHIVFADGIDLVITSIIGFSGVTDGKGGAASPVLDGRHHF